MKAYVLIHQKYPLEKSRIENKKIWVICFINHQSSDTVTSYELWKTPLYTCGKMIVNMANNCVIMKIVLISWTPPKGPWGFPRVPGPHLNNHWCSIRVGIWQSSCFSIALFQFTYPFYSWWHLVLPALGTDREFSLLFLLFSNNIFIVIFFCPVLWDHVGECPFGFLSSFFFGRIAIVLVGFWERIQ